MEECELWMFHDHGHFFTEITDYLDCAGIFGQRRFYTRHLFRISFSHNEMLRSALVSF